MLLYWMNITGLNKHDPNYSLCRATEKQRRRCPYRRQIPFKPEGQYGDHEAVLYKR